MHSPVPGSRARYRPRGHCGRTFTAIGGITLFLMLPPAARAATIVVQGGCTLIDAITAANTNAMAGSCAAGSGDDVIELTANVILTTVDHVDPSEGPNGLPAIASNITIEGGGWSIERLAGSPGFRILQVNAPSNLILRDLSVLNGRATIVGLTYRIGGAGISNSGTLTLVDTTVSGNQVDGAGFHSAGGGISNYGSLVMTSSTVSNNSVGSDTDEAHGGGIYSFDSAMISNSTISGNSATSAASAAVGGGVYVAAGTATVSSSTLSGNSRSGAGGAGAGGAIWGTPTTTIESSIFANSTGGNCAGPGLTDGGQNLADDMSCGTVPDTLSGLDPGLMDNGGPTMTHALLAGSSAIGGGGSCGVAKDQRGAPRGAVCDVGAFEFGGCPEIVLSDDTVLGTVVLESCQFAVGPNYAVVGPLGDLTLRAGREILLGDGFSVGPDAALTLEFDPSLIP